MKVSFYITSKNLFFSNPAEFVIPFYSQVRNHQNLQNSPIHYTQYLVETNHMQHKHTMRSTFFLCNLPSANRIFSWMSKMVLILLSHTSSISKKKKKIYSRRIILKICFRRGGARREGVGQLWKVRPHQGQVGGGGSHPPPPRRPRGMRQRRQSVCVRRHQQSEAPVFQRVLVS